MAVKLRLLRMGAKKKPFYRIVVADAGVKRDGKYIELVGTYNPVISPAEIKIDEEIALKWLTNGAIPTDTVKSLFNKKGINKKFHEMKSKTGKKTTTKVKKTVEVKKAPVAKKTTATKKASTKKSSKESK